jgi:hypothetical protein
MAATGYQQEYEPDPNGFHHPRLPPNTNLTTEQKIKIRVFRFSEIIPFYFLHSILKKKAIRMYHQSL